MSDIVPGVKADRDILMCVNKRFDLIILDNQVLVDVLSECLLLKDDHSQKYLFLSLIFSFPPTALFVYCYLEFIILFIGYQNALLSVGTVVRVFEEC